LKKLSVDERIWIVQELWDSIAAEPGFEAFQETAYLLQSPKNALRLLEAVQELGTLGGVERTLSK
jgi:PHD/YefM family antitoxin component YafN of YafNO toxin-antitoxin module